MQFRVRKRMTLEELDKRHKSYWMHVIGGSDPDQYAQSFDQQVREPTRAEVSWLSDEDLAEILAREPNTRLGHIAMTVLRRRDSWRGPARWALLISLISLTVAIAALVLD